MDRKCKNCKYWAINIPKDENGKQAVRGGRMVGGLDMVSTCENTQGRNEGIEKTAKMQKYCDRKLKVVADNPKHADKVLKATSENCTCSRFEEIVK